MPVAGTPNDKREESTSMKTIVRLRPVIFILLLLAVWQIAVWRHPDQLLPGPWKTAGGIADLGDYGLRGSAAPLRSGEAA